MKIMIEALPEGNFNIQTECPGPPTTINVLKQVIDAIEKAGMDGEIRGAQGGIVQGTAGQGAQMNRIREHWEHQRKNGMQP